METISRDLNDLLLQAHATPCISLYQPTHRHHPDNRQDPIRFKNLLSGLRTALEHGYPRCDHKMLLQPLVALTDDASFWNNALDGLAVLASDGFSRIYRLQRPLPERAVVSDSFHIKPLIRILQSADRYQLLALTRRSARLFEGNRDVLDEVPLADEVPRTIEEALGEELTQPYLTGSSRTSSGRAIFHGHGSRKDERDMDTERFFRAIDTALWVHHSRPSGLPLILVALPEHHATFRRVSRNPLLAKETIAVDPETLDRESLREIGWRAERPRYLALTAELTNRFRQAWSSGQASDELARVALAAVQGRVETLLVDADVHVPGRLDAKSGALQASAAADVDDLLDDITELVLKRGGAAVVIPSERMPTQTGIAAIYRY